MMLAGEMDFLLFYSPALALTITPSRSHNSCSANHRIDFFERNKPIFEAFASNATDAAKTKVVFELTLAKPSQKGAIRARLLCPAKAQIVSRRLGQDLSGERHA